MLEYMEYMDLNLHLDLNLDLDLDLDLREICLSERERDMS